MSDSIKEIQSKVSDAWGNSSLLAALSYIPLVGWIYPYLAKKDDDNCQFHSVQAVRMNIVLVVVFLVVKFLENFFVLEWLFGEGMLFNPISSTLWLACWISYLGLAIFSAYKAFNSVQWEVPYLRKGIDSCVSFVKSKMSRPR